MKFDAQSPECGMEIYTRLENGKAILEFAFFVEGQEKAEGVALIDLHLYDGEGACVLQLTHPLASEEFARGLLLHPHLWNSVEDPYLYRVEAYLLECCGAEEKICDRRSRLFPLCTFQRIPGKGWFLNGKPFVIKAVEYTLPKRDNEGEPPEIRLLQDVQQIQELGANGICLRKGKLELTFYELCCRRGLVILWTGFGSRRPSGEDMGAHPGARSGEERCIHLERLLDKWRRPGDLYYYYKALWSPQPFVHLCRNSLTRQENGLYRIVAYSNLKKMALHVEGILFEFQSGAPEFLFFDVKIARFPAVLTVEAQGYSMSVTVYGATCS